MSNKIEGYIIKNNGQKFPIGKITDKVDIRGNRLFTGDVVVIENKFLDKIETVVCTENGQIMGIFGSSKTQEGIKRWNVVKTKSYKDLKDGETFKGYNLKVVLEEKPKQNHVETIKHIVNGNTSIVILEDGSKGIAKCKFDKQKGFRMAYNRACGIEMDNEGNELRVNKELWSEFINGEVVVNCETKEDEELFFSYLNNKKITWATGSNIFNPSFYTYANHKNNTCFRKDIDGIAWSGKFYYIRKGYKVITFKELFNLTPPKQLSDYTNEELLEELKSRLE